jgi:uncharacterized caspase-like protein
MPNNDYAIVVGITRYPSLSDLKGPENDAVLFKEWLLDPQGGGLAPENVSMVLTSAHFNPDERDPLQARPTTEQVDAAFGRLVESGVENDGTLGRRLYIFMAGHGFSPDLEEAALLMANAGRLRTGFHIPGRRYANWFRAAAFFKEVVLFMDCCRDDYRRAPYRTPPWVEIRSPQAVDVQYFYAFATRWSRQARERPLSQDGAFQGVFTTALLAALRSSLPDPQGVVTGEGVAAYIYNYLPHLVDKDEYQEPEFIYDKARQFVFARRPAPACTPVCISFSQPDPSLQAEILAHDFSLAASLPSLQPEWDICLPPGRYLLRLVGTETRKVFDVIGTETIHETL